ncbi:MAG: diguanylate cyclase [Actinomycetota bacterium]
MTATARTTRDRAAGSIGRRRPRTAKQRENEEALRSIAEFLGAFMWQADADTLEILFMTKGVKDLTGHETSAWIGALEQWSELIDVEDRDEVVACLRAVAEDGHDRQIECRMRSTDGRTVWLRHQARRIPDPSGGHELWGVSNDITADKVAEAEARIGDERYRALEARAVGLQKQALEDPLTGLPNRTLFDDRFETALRTAARSRDPLTVLMLDLDHFKEINDTKGHQAGDAVLKHVALRLRIALRAQDTPARLGGDEFAGLLPNTDTEGAVRTAQRIVHAFDEPIEFQGETFRVGVSVGIANYPDNGEDAASLLAHADAAMYQAKANGGGYALGWTAADAERRSGARARRRIQRKRSTVSRRAMQMILGAAAVLLLVAGSMVPVGKTASSADSAARLDAAVVELAHVPESEVEGVVDKVEEALTRISWKDVSQAEVTATLDRLQRLLAGLSSYVSPSLSDRVERLIHTIDKARDVADAASGTLSRGRGAGEMSTPSPTKTAGDPAPQPTSSTKINLPPLGGAKH